MAGSSQDLLQPNNLALSWCKYSPSPGQNFPWPGGVSKTPALYTHMYALALQVNVIIYKHSQSLFLQNCVFLLRIWWRLCLDFGPEG